MLSKCRWAYLKAHANMEEAVLRFELDRYLGWPGQAPSYKVGERLWLQLRDETARREGDTYVLRAEMPGIDPDEDVEITAVETGGEALAQLGRTRYDCMIIDLKLPDTTGCSGVIAVAATGRTGGRASSAGDGRPCPGRGR